MTRIPLIFNVKNFNFNSIKVEKWIDSGYTREIVYKYKTTYRSINIINQNEGLLNFDFKLILDPDIGKVEFNSECIVFSTSLKYIITILKSDKDSIIRKKNKNLLVTINKFLLRRSLIEAKKLGEKEGLQFHGYNSLLEQAGISNITFGGKPNILELKEGKLIQK